MKTLNENSGVSLYKEISRVTFLIKKNEDQRKIIEEHEERIERGQYTINNSKRHIEKNQCEIEYLTKIIKETTEARKEESEEEKPLKINHTVKEANNNFMDQFRA